MILHEAIIIFLNRQKCMYYLRNNWNITENRSIIISKDLQPKRAQYATMWDFFKESSIWTDTDGVCHGP